MRRTCFAGIGLAALAILVSTGLVACSSDDAQLLGSIDLNGNWSFQFTNTSTTGVCVPENGDVSTDLITITEDLPADVGSAVTMSGFLGQPANVLTGEYQGNDQVLVSGSYPEDGGTTTTEHLLTFVTADRMEGTENWSWTGAGGDCPTNRASVVATRQ